MYTTTDLYLAATIIEKGINPDSFNIIDAENKASNIVVVSWDNDEATVIANKYHAGLMQVDPRAFKQIHLNIKKNVLRMLDTQKEAKDGETTKIRN